MKSKKGFTLVELLAVMIVLVLIVLMAYNIIKKNVDDTIDNSVRANAGVYIKGASSLINEKSINDASYDEGFFTVSQLDAEGLKISGTKPDDGYVLIRKADVVFSCLVYDDYYVIYSNGSVRNPIKGTCPDGSTVGTYEFDYTGDVQKFVAPFTATFKLEVWGAQGGSSSNLADAYGGYGGYSVGLINLSLGQELYINVGGKGTDGNNTSTTKNGGYNGGGNKVSPDADYYSAAGGGATHIALSNGLLSTFSSKTNELLIVAGGGGGGAGISGNYGYGGSGGGFQGNRGSNYLNNVGWGAGGTQLAGGCYNTSTSYCASFGAGYGTSSGHGGAGGGGYYGGGATYTNNIGGGGGGSGYIGNSLLTNKSMYCYNCTESNEPSTKTVSVMCAESDPTPECAKIGNGYARISFV